MDLHKHLFGRKISGIFSISKLCKLPLYSLVPNLGNMCEVIEWGKDVTIPVSREIFLHIEELFEEESKEKIIKCFNLRMQKQSAQTMVP